MTDSSGHRWPAARTAGSSRTAVRPPGGPGPPATPEGRQPALSYQRIALVDLLDRVLAGGVVIKGEVRLAIADVDLVTISVQALISSVSTALGEPDAAAIRDQPPPGNRPDDW